MWVKTVSPRFGDADALRHINNCMLPQWFELGRDPLCRIFMPVLDYDNFCLIMARISVDFVGQMRFGEDIEIRTYVKKVGRSSVTVYQEAWQGGQLGAKGDSTMVHYDFHNEKSVPIPQPIRDELEKHLLPEDSHPPRSRSGRFPVL